MPSQERKSAPEKTPEIHHRDRGERPGFSLGIPLLFSLLLLLPCLWQSRIQAIDLSSHAYNAWLVSLIAQNRAPGLWIARQSNNVLFDLMLDWLLPRFGAAAAQRIAVGISVLIFSWGAILLISRCRPRNWWFVLPSVAVLSYGFVFHLGFFNFYLGLGICFWYLACFFSGGWQRRLLITPLLALAWLAHPLPVVWAAGLAIYTAVAEHFRPQARFVLVVAAMLALLGVHFFLAAWYRCLWSINQAWDVTGANQLLLFDEKYKIPYMFLLAAWGLALWRWVRARPWRDVMGDLVFQRWLLAAGALAAIPSIIMFPQYALPFSFVSERLSLAAGVLFLALLAEVQLKHHEKALLVLSALMFFSFVFRDGQKLNRIENRIGAVVAQLPSHSRVIGFLRIPSQSRPQLLHAVDRACIGRCFSYASYEPSSRQFRVRAAEGNPIVMADYDDVASVETGDYVVQAGDLPAFLVYLCGSDQQQVCSHELHQGDVIGTIAKAQ
jgi:hypothetical protein